MASSTIGAPEGTTSLVSSVASNAAAALLVSRILDWASSVADVRATFSRLTNLARGLETVVAFS